MAPLRTAEAAGCVDVLCSAPESVNAMLAVGAALFVWLGFESSPSVVWDLEEAAAPPRRTPLPVAVALPRTMLRVM